MKLKDLKNKIDEILQQYPEASEALVTVDTEARRFPAHLINATDVYFDPNINKVIEENLAIITINLDDAEC